MVETDAVNYIKKQLQTGYNEGEIRNALLNSGWTEKDVNDAFYVVHGESQPVKPQKQPQSPQPQEVPQELSPPPQIPPDEPDFQNQGQQPPPQQNPLPEAGKPLGTEGKEGGSAMSKIRIGALVCIIGGVIILLNYAMVNFLSMEDLLIMIYGEVVLVTYLTTEMIEIIVLATGIISILLGVLTMIKPRFDLYFGIVVSIIGLASVISGNGYIIGGIVCVAGGSLSIIRK